MQRNNGARFFPLIITILVIALVIAAIVSIGRAIFNGGDSSEQTSQVDENRENLLNSSTGRSVSMTVRGPIVAEENFTSYRIEVSNAERSMKVYTGYLEEETNGKTLGNNTQAYEQFVHALDKANMTKGTNESSEEADQDLRGICARGFVYEYSVLSGGNTVRTLWTSTCSGSKGTLDASRSQLTQLFMAQIPDSSSLVPFRQTDQLQL